MTDFWIHSGLRTSELAGALWSAVDWKRKTLLVRRANVRGEEKEVTKTKRTRTVALNSKAYDALLRQKKHTEQNAQHIWLDPRYGTPWNDERAYRRSFWVPTLEALQIRYRRPYQMRHTFATMMLMAGVNPALAAKRMGHSIQMFLKRYARWIDDGSEAIHDAKLEDFLGSRRLGPAPEANTP